MLAAPLISAAGMHRPDGSLAGVGQFEDIDWAELIRAGGDVAGNVIRAMNVPTTGTYPYTVYPTSGAGLAGLSPVLLIGGGLLLLFALRK